MTVTTVLDGGNCCGFQPPRCRVADVAARSVGGVGSCCDTTSMVISSNYDIVAFTPTTSFWKTRTNQPSTS